MRRLSITLLLGLSLLAPPSVAAPMPARDPVAAPQLGLRSIAQLPRPLPAPYDAGVDAHAAVTAAHKRARASGKRLLIDFGANWCVDCRVLAAVLGLPRMRPWLARHFEVVQVDVGAFDRNLDIARLYGLATLEAVPAVLIVDPKGGKLLNRASVLGLGDARIMQPQQMADWLAKWAK